MYALANGVDVLLFLFTWQTREDVNRVRVVNVCLYVIVRGDSGGTIKNETKIIRDRYIYICLRDPSIVCVYTMFVQNVKVVPCV